MKGNHGKGLAVPIAIHSVMWPLTVQQFHRSLGSGTAISGWAAKLTWVSGLLSTISSFNTDIAVSSLQNEVGIGTADYSAEVFFGRFGLFRNRIRLVDSAVAGVSLPPQVRGLDSLNDSNVSV